jgi:succinate dehydrogenase/fumarate reductase flavoprotein subunit
MAKDEIRVSSESAVSMPMKNLIAIVGAVAMGVWAYFGVIERLNRLETNTTLLTKDLEQAEEALVTDIEKNNEFRIKWPRGDLGSPPADSEQFMLIEFLSGQVEQIQKDLQNMMNNAVNIERLQKDMDKVLADVEELKDKIRDTKISNGNHKTGE